MMGTGSYYREGNPERRRDGWEEGKKRTEMEELRERAQTWKGKDILLSNTDRKKALSR